MRIWQLWRAKHHLAATTNRLLFRGGTGVSAYTGGRNAMTNAGNRVTQQPPSTSHSDVPMRPPATVDQVIRQLDDTPQDFDFWQDLRESMPPWISEVVGFALIVFGILSFISLFVAADSLVAVSWADMLTALFGDGAVFVAAALFALGAALWLPKAGIRVSLTAGRMLALELAFLSALALLHIGGGESELRALARAGQGGGLIGWGLSYPVYWIAGREIALAFFGCVAAVSGIFALGLRGSAITSLFARLGERFQKASEGVRSDLPPMDEGRQLYQQLVEQPGYRRQIMRIRPDPNSAPSHATSDDMNKGGTAPALERIRPGSPKPQQSAIEESAQVELRERVTPKPNGAGARRRGRNGAQRADGATADQTDIWRDSLPDMDSLTALDLKLPGADETQRNARLIENTLLEFDIEVSVAEAQVGPTVTRYALKPHKDDGSERVRMSKIAGYARDLALALAAKRLRMETPVPGANYMGIEVPNSEASIVALRNVTESDAFLASAGSDSLRLPLGRDVVGEPVAVDLAQMPHLLIAGATGSGKSVCMAALATALLMQFSPDQLRLVMLDPKMVELARFNGIPHLLGPVEIVPERIVGTLQWCAREMERRYQLLERAGVRHVIDYNAKLPGGDREGDALPRIVILIDEIGDLMLSSPEETQEALARLAQKARAVGMHLVIATQRPSVNVITGVIKANFPARIAFAVASSGDSRVIIDRAGAEDLLGQGDMLFQSPSASAPVRLQGCFVSEDDVREVVQHWRDEKTLREKAGVLREQRHAPWEGALKRRQFLSETDPMLEDALRLIVESGEASASLLQRTLGLGYPRAARIIDLLAELGVIGAESENGRGRAILISPDADPIQYALSRYQPGKLSS